MENPTAPSSPFPPTPGVFCSASAGSCLPLGKEPRCSQVVSAGMWGEVNRIRGQMKEKGVKKQPGYSWTEIANRVHMFVGGDASHPEMNKIISELRKISFHMQMMANETHTMVEMSQESR